MFGQGTDVALVIGCETCGSDMRLDVLVLDHDPAGVPILRLDYLLSQETFECPMCGALTHTGDIEQMCFHEPGSAEDEDEDEEYDDEEN